MKDMLWGRDVVRTMAVLGVMLTLGFLVFSGPSTAYAGDHLAAESPGCTDCHGTNVRQVHDDTVPLDCDTCHSTGGKNWYLNDICKDYLIDGGILPEQVVGDTGYWQLDLPDGLDFNFACKACHVGSNPGHQSGD